MFDATLDIIELIGFEEMMLSQRGQPNHSGSWIAGVLLVILIILFLVFRRTDFVRFIFYLFQILLEQ